MTVNDQRKPVASGTSIKVWLHMEGAAVAVAGLVYFAYSGASWWLFAMCLLVPDVAMLGYLWGNRVGAWAYNVAHSYSTPLAFAVLGWSLGWTLFAPLSAIWVVHIGLDRALGYGLKYPHAFKATHLSAV